MLLLLFITLEFYAEGAVALEVIDPYGAAVLLALISPAWAADAVVLPLADIAPPLPLTVGVGPTLADIAPPPPGAAAVVLYYTFY